MQKFNVHKGLVAPMDRANVDTDAIIPKQFLKSIKRTGFGPNLFDEWAGDKNAEGIPFSWQDINGRQAEAVADLINARTTLAAQAAVLPAAACGTCISERASWFIWLSAISLISCSATAALAKAVASHKANKPPLR